MRWSQTRESNTQCTFGPGDFSPECGGTGLPGGDRICGGARLEKVIHNAPLVPGISPRNVGEPDYREPDRRGLTIDIIIMT